MPLEKYYKPAVLTFLMSKKKGILGMRKVKVTSKMQVTLPRKMVSESFPRIKEAVILSYPHRLVVMSEEEFERLYPALMSEASLARDWLSPEDEKAWKDL